MPFLLIPIFFIVIGVVMICILGLVFGLIHIFFWPVVIGLFVWWLLRRNDHHQRPHYHHTTRHPDWQEGLHQRKEAHNVHEEATHKSDDDWSDF
ncbi:hypothetical protein [Lacticaseibacillus jixiensis]|uniref:hypothetical protein n=1 Tax=Lacticaseibacillus jixiensis TaxID=3231926 RepID=UPI0036F26190